MSNALEVAISGVAASAAVGSAAWAVFAFIKNDRSTKKRSILCEFIFSPCPFF